MLAEIQRLRYRHALLLTSAASPDDGLSSPNPRQLYTTQCVQHRLILNRHKTTSILSCHPRLYISVFHRHSILMTTRLVCLASASSTLGTEIMFPLQSPCCPYLFTTHSQLVTQQYHCITAYFHPQFLLTDKTAVRIDVVLIHAELQSPLNIFQ